MWAGIRIVHCGHTVCNHLLRGGPQRRALGTARALAGAAPGSSEGRGGGTFGGDWRGDLPSSGGGRSGALSVSWHARGATRGPRGAKGWGWYHRTKEELARGKADPEPYPESLPTGAPRPIVYLDVSIEDENAGRLLVELASDIAPRTVENFVRLCTHNTDGGFGLRDSLFHLVLSGEVAVGGDIDGNGGKCAVPQENGSPFFDDESFAISHAHRGVVSMASNGVDRNGSQFFITLADCSHLDGRHCAFGRVIDGENVLDAIDAVYTVSGRPLVDTKITGCGILGMEETSL